MEGKKTMIRDLTQGNLTSLMIRFSLPFMAANLMNMLYTLVDLAIVGKFVGSIGLSAVSVAGQITMICYAVGSGYGNGSQIYIAQLVGAGRKKELNETIGTVLTFCGLISLVICTLGITLARPLLTLLNTPDEAMSSAIVYLRVCCCGFPFTYIFATFSDMLRGMGDSKRPFVIISVSAVMNIILDFLFIAGFNWGAFGAAFATVLSQVFSCVFAMIYLYRRRESFGFDFKRSSFRIVGERLKIVTKLGAPLIVMTMAINISMMIVTAYVNAYGVTATAVAGVGGKLYSVMNVVTSAVQAATASMVGQNLAAGKQDRATKTVYIGWAICLGFFAIVAACCLLIPRQIFGIFSSDPDVLELAVDYLRIAVWMFLAFALMAPTLGLINGVGFTSLNLVVALLDGVAARIGFSLLFGITLGYGLRGFWIGSALAGYVSVILSAIYFFSMKWKKRKLTIEQH
jgi:putative MATE family efflux protein